jgi:type IV secretory pathway VirB2 component (pilin)
VTSPQSIATGSPLARKGGVRLENVLRKPWARLSIPSLSDLYFVAVMVWVCMSGGAAGWEGLLADADVGWHIRTGQWILDHHAVPHHDLYSFSKPDAPWYAWEWGSDVIFGSLHRAAGLKGVVLFAGVLIALFAWTLLRRMVGRGVHLLWAMSVSLLGVGAASIHFLARPHLFTLLFLSIAVWMIDIDRQEMSERSARRLWLLVPLTIVWTNLHGGFLALIAVLGLTAVGAAAEAWLGNRDFRVAGRYLCLAAACAASSLINPYGYRLHTHVAEYLRSDWIRNTIQEFQSPIFRSESVLQFEGLMLIGLIAAGALFRRRRIAEGLWIVYFAHMSLGSVRHVPIFVTVCAPVIAAEISDWWRMWTARAKKSTLAGIVNQMSDELAPSFERISAWPFLLVGTLVVMGAPIKWPKDFPALIFPVKMIHEHEAQIFDTRVLTTDQWGDYLIYLNPKQRVYVDGRSDFYGPEVGNQYLRLIGGQWDWKQIMTKNEFKSVLLPSEDPICQLLKGDPEWRVEQDSGKTILLVHR